MTTEKNMGRLDAWYDCVGRWSRYGAWFGGALIAASALYVVVDVVLRKLVGTNLTGSDELAGYALAIGFAWSMAFTIFERAHIRIDVVYQHLPVRWAALFDWLASVALAMFLFYLTRHAWGVVQLSWDRGTTANSVLATPLWIPHVLWGLGLTWMCLVLAIVLLRASLALVRGELATVRNSIGMRSAQEEALEEGVASARRIAQEARA